MHISSSCDIGFDTGMTEVPVENSAESIIRAVASSKM